MLLLVNPTIIPDQDPVLHYSGENPRNPIQFLLFQLLRFLVRNVVKFNESPHVRCIYMNHFCQFYSHFISQSISYATTNQTPHKCNSFSPSYTCHIFFLQHLTSNPMQFTTFPNMYTFATKQKYMIFEQKQRLITIVSNLTNKKMILLNQFGVLNFLNKSSCNIIYHKLVPFKPTQLTSLMTQIDEKRKIGFVCYHNKRKCNMMWSSGKTNRTLIFVGFTDK